MTTNQRCNEGAQKLRDEFYVKIMSGILTETDLSKAVETVVEGIDGQTCSIGTDWIANNPTGFQKIVSDPTTFARGHLHVPEFARAVVSNDSLLRLVPEDDRMQLVEFAFTAHGAYGEYVAVWLRSGLKRKFIAKILEARLESSPRDADIHGNSRTYVHQFLESVTAPDETWGGPISPHSPWAMFKYEQLVSVFEHCARKSPRHVLRVQNALALVLRSSDLSKILVLAVSLINSPLEPELVQRVPLTTRRSLCLRMFPMPLNHETALRLIIEVCKDEVAAGGEHAGTAFFNTVRFQLDAMNPVTVSQMVFEGRDRALPDSLLSYAWNRPEKEGYLRGTIERDYYGGENGRTSVRWKVVFGDKAYVQDKFQERLGLRDGDMVLFRPADAIFLTRSNRKSVFAVLFQPANKPRR